MSKIKLSDYEFFLFFIGCFYFLWLFMPKLFYLDSLISVVLSVVFLIIAFLALRYSGKMIVSRRSVYLSLTSSVLVYFSVFAFPIAKRFILFTGEGFLLVVLFLSFLIAFMDSFSSKIFSLTLAALFALLFLMQQGFGTITNVILLIIFGLFMGLIFWKMYEGNLSFKANSTLQILLAFFVLAEIRVLMGVLL
jgi:hypothetical protein